MLLNSQNYSIVDGPYADEIEYIKFGANGSQLKLTKFTVVDIDNRRLELEIALSNSNIELWGRSSICLPGYFTARIFKINGVDLVLRDDMIPSPLIDAEAIRNEFNMAVVAYERRKPIGQLSIELHTLD